MDHDEIWDDSALIVSWNQALEEYKKYHSIHARGGTIDDLVEKDTPTSLDTHQDLKPRMSGGSTAVNDTAKIEPTVAADTTTTEKVPLSSSNVEAQNGPAHAVVAGPSPHAVLASVQDEGFKKLLMSWYYAGYYTGLNEGQRQANTQDVQTAP